MLKIMPRLKLQITFFNSQESRVFFVNSLVKNDKYCRFLHNGTYHSLLLSQCSITTLDHTI